MDKTIGERYNVTPDIKERLVKATDEIVESVLGAAGVKVECSDERWLKCREIAGMLVLGVFMNGFDHASGKNDEKVQTDEEQPFKV